MIFSNVRSIKPMTKAKIKEATNTSTALFCRDEYLGQVTLFFISSMDSTTKFLTFILVKLVNNEPLSVPSGFEMGSYFLHASKNVDPSVSDMVLSLVDCTGGEIRTPINGFGDRYSAIELRPYITTLN